MSGFAASWLAMREPADHRARNTALMDRAVAWLRGDGDLSPTIVDLGCGTGSTLAAFDGLGSVEEGAGAGFAPHWRLLDNDPALLAAAAERAAALGIDAETRVADLGDSSAIPLGGARLVTASALFDLASQDFITALATRIAAEGAGLYAALNYDGSTTFAPSHPLDGIIVAGFNRHQLRPKGLGIGPSLGPAAARALAAALKAHGYVVELAESPWKLGAEDAELAVAHVEGMASAVAELDVLQIADLDDWRSTRVASAGSGSATIGHLDLLALPG